MNCPKCGHQNPENNRFCGMCGTSLERRGSPDTELLPEDAEHSGRPDQAASDSGADLRRRVRQGFDRGLERNASPPPKRPDLEDLAIAAAQPPEPERRRANFTQDSTSMFHLNDGPPAEEHAPSGVMAGDVTPGVTGPSFLGLSDAGNVDYLLEERRGGAKNWVLLFLVLAIGGLVYAQYRANRRGETLFAGLPAITAPRPAKPAPPPPPGAQQNSGQPELSASAPNEKLKQEQPAVKPPETENPAGTPAKPESDQPDQKTANAASAAPENKPAATAEKKPDDTAQKPEADNSDEEAAAPAKKERAASKPARVAPEKPAGSDLLEQAQHYLYGPRKSCDQALNLIHQAANQGNAKARAQLGGLYATGNCVPFDRATAYRWFSLALQAAPGNAVINRNRQMLWSEMSEQERARVQANLD